jgi:hypothetical protein
MDESEIYNILMRVAGSECVVPEDIRKVFSLLVSSTLRHRDCLKKDLDIILTVEDVRVTLNWLLESIHSKRLPETNNAIRMDLFKIWFDELKPYL